MTQQEADKIVSEMGCHPYSRLAMIDALLEGEKIGKKEQKAIDNDLFREVKKMLIDWACEWLEGHAWIDGMEYRFDITDFRKAMEEE